ncbi:GNAT family N-acetyltransferase [Dysgonomonas termitidis]|uniref:GNAT family N-acetyltransferase n=1 Tax=Dysgonomonas termitidis TaxID=1516126 RepID=A0ABV9KXH2_9BACT
MTRENKQGPITLQPVRDEDVPMIKQWLYKEYILEWYHEPDEWIREIEEREGEFGFLNHYIVYDGNTPFAFCQYYDCFDAQEEWYTVSYPARTYSIDYLIGESSYLGRGYGKAIVKALINKIKSHEGAMEIVVKPEKENIPSCKTLLSCGFTFNDDKQYYTINL